MLSKKELRILKERETLYTNSRNPEVETQQINVVLYKEASSVAPTPCTDFCAACPLGDKVWLLSKRVSLKRYSLGIDGKYTRIAKASFRLLCAFYRYADRPLSRKFLLEYAWGEESKVLNNVNVAISELRSILHNSDIEITTIRGKGYQMIKLSKPSFEYETPLASKGEII